MRATGQSGELRYGYATAARLGRWVIESAAGAAFEFSAPIVARDEAWLARRPLTLVLAIGQVEWAWTDVEPAVEGSALTIRLTRRPDASGPRLAEERSRAS